MTDAAALNVAASRQALHELRRARRTNHRDAVHWVDAIYRVYISGLTAIVVVVLGSSVFGEQKASPVEAAAFAARATPWLGLAFALAAGVGLRSGGRGGPLTLQAATVQHELMAPVPVAEVLREPALKQLRFLGFAGACAGAIVAMTGVRQLPVGPVPLVLGSAAAFAVAVVAAVSLAMLCSGRRIRPRVTNLGALALLGWSALDLAFGIETSPFTLLGRLAFAAFSFTPLSLVPVLLTAVLVPVALAGIGGTSIDDARRRAGLVAQLRFAVTLQDIRTVVLLRRQLSQETPRGRPWIRMKRGGRLPATWRRDWRCYFRFPLGRLARLLFLAVTAGVALGVTWNGVRPVFLVAVLAIYLAAYDAVEPLAQEVDHPTRWDAMPEDHGMLLLRHLPAAFVVMVVVCAIAAGVSLLWVPAEVVAFLVPLIGWVVALAAVSGAALSTAMGSPDMSKMMAGAGADVMGFILLLRLVGPPALTAAALAPMFALGTDLHELNYVRAQNFSAYPALAAIAAIMYVRFRKPNRI